jgi:hypothetical protein
MDAAQQLFLARTPIETARGRTIGDKNWGRSLDCMRVTTPREP